MKYSDLKDILPSHIEDDSPMWEFKHDLCKLDVIKKGDPYTYSSQYQQDPSPAGGGMFKDEYWKYYEILPSDVVLMRMYADTAQKTAEHNDYSVFQVWAKSAAGPIYLVDQCRGKWEAPELESRLVDFWNKHKPCLKKPMGVSCVMIEDKSSGSSLIQSISRNYTIPVEAVQRNRDKIVRAHGVVKWFASGHVYLPQDADFLFDYKDEFSKFTPLMSHRHDDQIDPTMDAVEDLLVNFDSMYHSDMF